jgi:outer membrane protein assembly factor BamD
LALGFERKAVADFPAADPVTPQEAAEQMSAFLRQIRARAIPAALLVIAAQTSTVRADLLDPITNLFNGGGEKYKTEITPDIPAETIYNQGLAKLKAADYEGAAKKFGELEKQFPFSQWARKGLLMTAYAQYEKPAYDDAVQSAKRYVELYPRAPDTPYMYYITGMSYYNQITNVMQDQTNAEKALQAFTALLEKFPNSEYAPDAKTKMAVARDQLAAKEMQIGRFYLTRRNFPAAINRFHEVLGKYQITRHTEEALYRLTEAYLAMGVSAEAQTAAAILGHNFPDSQWYHDAAALLKSGGLAPQEHTDSWISKISKTLHAS